MKKILFLTLIAFASSFASADAAVPNRLQFDRDINGSSIPFQIAPTYTDKLVITAGTPKNFTPPAAALYVSFSREVDFYAKAGITTGANPVVDTTDGTAWEINPIGYWLVNPDGTKVTSIRVDVRTTGAVAATYYTAR